MFDHRGVGGMMNGYAIQRNWGCSLLMHLLYATTAWPFSLGIENHSHPILKILTQSAVLPRVGLITNQSGCDQNGKRTVDILHDAGVRIVYILVPEHGFDGTIPSGKAIPDTVDKKTRIPIVSIYNVDNDGGGKSRLQSLIPQLDIILYDLQDVGVRHYTYISTLYSVLHSAAQGKKPVVVFDRPLVSGMYMEGPLVDQGNESFVSIASIPLRYAMTIGELALYFNKALLHTPTQLIVVPMEQYERGMPVPFLAKLSPNIVSLQSAIGYSVLGALGTIDPIYVAWGTPRSFQVIMTPDTIHIPSYEWQKLKGILKTFGIHATPTTMNKDKRTYTGLYFRFPEQKLFSSMAVAKAIIEFFKECKMSFSFNRLSDKAFGTDAIKKWILGEITFEVLACKINKDLDQFYKKAEPYFLYKPAPVISYLPIKRGA